MKNTTLGIALVVVGCSLAIQPAISAQNSGSSESPTQTPTVADLRGIYVDSNALPISTGDSTALVTSLKVAGVDGLVLVVGWNHIEPAKGKFNWTALDQWMNIAISAGKKVELSIRADYHTPSWLFQPQPNGGGARPVFFSFTRKPVDTTCLPETIAAPWDTLFLAQWSSMLDSVSAHLKHAGTYDAVVLLRLTGINKDSDELHLPARQPSAAPCASDAVATWLTAGYRPSLMLKGWDGTTSAFKNSFPDKSFSVAIIASTNPFPPIAEDGSVITGAIPNQNLPLLTLASLKFPGHLVIQNNSLYPGVPAETETVQAAESLKTMIAFQTNEEITGLGAACGGTGDTTHCTDSTYLAELETGIYPKGTGDPMVAQYLEVFALNANALPGVILKAHDELFAAHPTGVPAQEAVTPISLELEQNYPNPFNPSTTIRFALPQRVRIRLTVYNELGQKVADLINREMDAGSHEVRFDASHLPSGVYFYKLRAGDVVRTRSLLVLR